MLIDLTVKPMSSITASASTLKSISSSSIFGRQKNKLESFSLSFHKWALIGLLHDHLYAQETKPNRRMKTKQNKTKQNENKTKKTRPRPAVFGMLSCVSDFEPTSLLVLSNFFSISTLCKNWRVVWVKQRSSEHQKRSRTLQGYICENSRWTLSITKHRLVCVGNIYADCCREILA